MMTDKNKRVVVVAGPGRSGTSAITRGLSVLGVDLGDNLMPAVAGVNDKGFWEDQDIYRINLDIFEALNFEWHDLSVLDFSRMDDFILGKLRSRALEILSRKLAGIECFGIKDPQMTRILPFWQGIFSELSLDVSYIIACRSPHNVALSLRRYTGFDDAKCLLLWFEYALASMVHTAGATRVVVDYDLMLSNPSLQLRRVAEGLGFVFNAGSDEFQAYRDEFLDNSLRHAKDVRAAERAELTLTSNIASLFEFLSVAAIDKQDINSEEAISYVADLAAARRKPEIRLEYALCELKNVRSSLKASRAAFDSISTELALRTDALETAGGELLHRTEELVQTRELLVKRTDMSEALSLELTARNEDLVAAREALQDLSHNLNKLNKDIELRDHELIEARGLLLERTALAETFSGELARLTKELIEERELLAQRTEIATVLDRDLKERTQSLVDTIEQFDMLKDRIQALDAELGRRTEKLAELESALRQKE